MPNVLRRSWALAVPVWGALGLLWPALAQPAPAPAAAPSPLALDGLAAMLTNMGYETRLEPGGKQFAITVRGTYDLNVHFTMGAPGSEVLAYIYLAQYTPEQLAKLNMKALLLANDAGPCYFSLSNPKDKYNLYLQRSMPAAGATPITLRAALDTLARLTYANGVYWDVKQWKPD